MLFLKHPEKKKALKTHFIKDRFYATVWWISPRETVVCKYSHGCIRWHLEVPSILNDFIILCANIWGVDFFSTPVFFALTWTVSRSCCKIPQSDPEYCSIIPKHWILHCKKKKGNQKSWAAKRRILSNLNEKGRLWDFRCFCIHDFRKIHIHLLGGWSC